MYRISHRNVFYTNIIAVLCLCVLINKKQCNNVLISIFFCFVCVFTRKSIFPFKQNHTYFRVNKRIQKLCHFLCDGRVKQNEQETGKNVFCIQHQYAMKTGNRVGDIVVFAFYRFK